jgi:hypothetical protein
VKDYRTSLCQDCGEEAADTDSHNKADAELVKLFRTIKE